MIALAKILVGHSMPLFCRGFKEDLRRTPGVDFIETAVLADDILSFIKRVDFHIIFLYDEIEHTPVETIIKGLKSAKSNAALILLTMSHDMAYIKKWLTKGVNGIMRCNANVNCYKNAITTVLDGKFHICPDIADLLAGNNFISKGDSNAPEVIFNHDEKLLQFFNLRKTGLSLDEIKVEMETSISTVKRCSIALQKIMEEKGFSNIFDYCSKTGYH